MACNYEVTARNIGNLLTNIFEAAFPGRIANPSPEFQASETIRYIEILKTDRDRNHSVADSKLLDLYRFTFPSVKCSDPGDMVSHLREYIDTLIKREEELALRASVAESDAKEVREIADREVTELRTENRRMNAKAHKRQAEIEGLKSRVSGLLNQLVSAERVVDANRRMNVQALNLRAENEELKRKLAATEKTVSQQEEIDALRSKLRNEYLRNATANYSRVSLENQKLREALVRIAWHGNADCLNLSKIAADALRSRKG